MTSAHYPIVYVRGYAGSQKEVEDTVATPYMGFNLGSTKIRQLWDGEIRRHIFESPLIRLMKDHGYSDVYNHGDEIDEGQSVATKSLWIYRYYEPVSKDIGLGVRPEIEDYARGLHRLVEKIRTVLCGPADSPDPAVDEARRDFKVYLVAHSMGGLIVRCYLQNIYPNEGTDDPKERAPVDKVFTYATPHGGIDFRLIGNVPAFMQVNNIDNFNEDRMRTYLKLPSGSVKSLGEAFDPNRFFCLIGTNQRDYTAGMGMSSAAVGPSSDGLVQIKNAYVDGAPRAFVHKSHSGHFGIVNSEEGYQNLRRFLFGEFQVDVFLRINDINLPAYVQKEKDKGHEVKASYHVETIARVRGARWDLNRRTVNEESALFLDYQRMRDDRPIRLFSGFLLESAKVGRRRSLGFSLELGVLVPEYEINKRWRLDQHFDGGYIFRDKVNLDLTFAATSATLKYGWDSKSPNRATTKAELAERAGIVVCEIPVVRKRNPGIDAMLVIESSRRQ